MKQFTFSAVMANNLLTVLQGCSKSIRLLLVMFLTLTVTTNAWGAVTGDTFTRISAASDLSDGDEIIFVNQDGTYACGTTQNSNNRTPVAITTSSNSYSYKSSDNVQVFIVKVNGSNYGFHNGSGYIYSASTSSNYLRTNTTASTTAPSGTAAWTLSVSDNVFTVKNASNTSYYLAFNGTSYFSQYKTGQSKPYIYKKNAAPAVKHKAYFYNGTTLLNAGGTEFAEGAAVSYSGSTPLSCDGMSTTFVGWATSTWNGKVAKGDIVPDFYNIIDGEDLPEMGTADVNYYAVFAKKTSTPTSNTLTLNSSNLSSAMGGSYSSNDFSYSGISFGRSNAAIMSSTIQIKAGTSNAVWNKTELPGAITSITVTKKTNNSVLTVGTLTKPTTNSKTVSSTTTYTFTESNNYRYFKIAATSSYTQVTSVIINYSATLSTYSDYITTCTEPSTFTVTYDKNGATSGSVPTGATEYAKDAQVTVLGNTGNLAKTGYTFSGWNTEANGTGTTYAAGATFTITENTTLYAKWTANTYTITFNTNGGTINAGNVTSYEYGVGATLPTNVTKENHQFGGWFDNSSCTGTAVTTISTTATDNKEYWAKWNPAVYTINYKDQGDVAFSGTHEEGYPQTHTYNTETTLKSASKDHYTFGGWYKESNCSGTPVTTLGATEYTDEITLYAKWTAKTYTITLDANGGTFVDNRDSQTKGSATFDYIYGTYATYNDAPNLTEYYTDLKRDGYQFDGWVSAGSPWNKLFTNTGDRTIQAQWSKLYSITLSENGTPTTPTTQTSTSYTLLTELSAGSCQDDTKELVGWSTVAIPNPGDKPTSNFYELGATVTLTADQTTFYAVFATAEGNGGGGEGWVLTDIANIDSDDVVVITMTNGETTWAMTNANGTSGPPTASPLTVDGNKLSSTIADVVKWNISNNDGDLTIYPNGTTETWLYCTSTNNGVRVGTNDNKIFTIAGNYLKNTGTSRYVGVYTDNPDWRCYTNTTGNIANQTLGFYVKSVSYSGYVTHCEVCTVTELTLTPSASEVNLGEAGNAVVTFTPTGGNGGTVSYVASPNTGVTWNNNEATFTKAGTYTITASQVKNGDNCPTEATTTVVVTATPVLYFWEEPADPIVFGEVECGGNTAKANKKSVSLRGYNLTGSVNVTVEGDYKIAKTATEEIANYKKSQTLEKTDKGKIDSSYDDVYIIATPPAGSIDPTTGTLKFTTKDGNTLMVNLSTPTITCKEYTLTFNDRGVETTAQYYAGVEVDEPEQPTGVCTEPINYVFDGWATATVAEGSTTYEKVSFGSYTMPKQNITLYAVYRYVEEGSGDSGELEKVTDIAQVTTDATYAIISFDEAYYLPNTQATSNPSTGSIAKEDGVITVVDAMKWNVSIAGDKFVFTSVADANNILWGAVANDGIRINETSAKQNPTKEWSLETVNDYGLVLFHTADNAAHKYLSTYGVTDWRNYYSTNLNATNRAANLYKLSTGTTYYTTSPVCGPHLAITEGKDIYVTGGNAGGTRDLVIAQQKVSYKATRLEKDKLTGNLPSIKALPSNIVFDNTKTKAVAVTFDEDSVRTLQSDGTYTITGNITIAYQPKAANVTDDIQVTLNANYNPSADVSQASFTVHARSLPDEFVIVAKSGDKWYALNADMSSSKTHPANGQVVVDDTDSPTEATYAPCNAIYTFDGMPNTGDRTYVRFQGTDGAWLWASTGDNTGIQNNTLAQNPAGDANPYNWKLTTTDNVTYQFSNANNNRNLRLNDEKFGMYTSGVQDIRILPVEAKCIYNYAPTNLKVSVLKGTYATLTWDAVQGATKYQYCTDATNWTDCGTEPTATINGLTETTAYTYYVRAYHEDADITQECIDYATVSFTTAACDDVPTNITYSADLNSITVSWTAVASNAIVKLYSDEEGTVEVKNSGSTTLNPYTFKELNKNTTYYLQVFAGGICASEIVEVSTQDVELNIVEWQPDGIVVDINTNEKVKVTLENEVSCGSGTGTLAEDLFFSKYFEGSGSLKMLAIYNGTGKDVDLSTYRIDRGTNGDATDISITYDLSQLDTIKNGQEIVFYSWPLAKNTQGNAEYSYECSKSYLNNVATKSGQEDNPRWILCGDDPTGKATPIYDDAMNFSGDDPLLLRKNEVLIDVIGVSTKTTGPTEKTLCTGRSEEAWSADGVTNMDYGKTEEDFEEGEIPHGVNVDDETITAYTARVIMFRKNTVVSGDDAVTKNIDNFVTFADEWEARQVCMHGDDGDLTCAAYQELGKFNYSEYYTKYESMDQDQEFDTNNRNADGTLTVPITELFKQSCRNIKITLKDAADNVLKEQPYKVPIMITSTQGTDGQAFLDLQQNLATVEVDGSGNPTGNKTNLTLEQVREICKTCDVVVRDNATLTKVTDGTTNDHPQVNNVYIYEGASLVVPDGNYTYNVNGLSLRRREDQVPSLSVQGGEELKVNAESIYLDVRVNAENWHWFTLPYDCDIADVTWVDGTPANYGVDWFLSTYDGEKRAATQSGGCWAEFHGETIKAGVGYIVGIKGDITKPKYTFELRFPMSTEVLANELTDKTVPVNAWGVENDMLDNHRGWNLVGNPYLDYYQKNYLNSFGGLRLGGKYKLNDDNYWVDSGEWDGQPDGNLPYVVEPINGGWSAYNQVLVSSIDLLPFTAYFVQVGTKGHTNGERKDVLFDGDNRGRASIARRAPSSVSEQEEPVIVGVSLTNSKGESDMTSLVIDDKYTDEYEMNADFFKWFGDYYRYYTRPVVYTIGADKQQRAFNAINEEQAAKPVSMGTYTAQNGEYTFSLDRRSDLTRVKEVWLHDATESAYINLMQEDYSFSTGKTDGTGRFTLAVTLHPKSPTDITDGMNGQVYVTSQQRMLYVNNLPQQARVWVYDAVGKLLVNESTNVYQRAYHVGQAGVYFVRVESQNGCETLQAVVE